MESDADGRSVVLRLMWGPLPAPFPRALAAAGVAAAAVLLLVLNLSLLAWCLAALLAVVPLAALHYQRAGERLLQRQLGAALGGIGFLPRPH